jgi:hypothetical protein
MKVYGTEITDEQIAAALAAMRGTFTMHTVTVALIRAGARSDGPVAGRAVDRLLQRERKAGRIKVNPANKREWMVA